MWASKFMAYKIHMSSESLAYLKTLCSSNVLKSQNKSNHKSHTWQTLKTEKNSQLRCNVGVTSWIFSGADDKIIHQVMFRCPTFTSIFKTFFKEGSKDPVWWWAVYRQWFTRKSFCGLFLTASDLSLLYEVVEFVLNPHLLFQLIYELSPCS